MKDIKLNMNKEKLKKTRDDIDEQTEMTKYLLHDRSQLSAIARLKLKIQKLEKDLESIRGVEEMFYGFDRFKLIASDSLSMSVVGPQEERYFETRMDPRSQTIID